MTTESIQIRYIRDRFAQGGTEASVQTDLAALGWHPESIRLLLQRARAQGAAGLHPSPSPGPDLGRLPTRLSLDGMEVEVQMRMHRPSLALFGSFLTPEECDELIALSRPRMERSRVIVGEGDVEENGVLAYSRTSEQANIKRGTSALVDRIQRRVSLLTRWPEECMESLQVVHYGVGADFAPHHDYFCPNAHADLIAREGQRVGTLLMYLNTPQSGGATSFPDVELEIYPQRGAALFFGYPRPEPETHTLHAGVPLGEGEKWIATFFLRDRAQQPQGSAHSPGSRE